jgi:hypothetical protein
MKGPPGDWSITGFIVAQAHRLRRARLASVTDQSDHRPDPKPNLPSDATDAEPLGPQGQCYLHFPSVALLDGTSSKLLTVGTSTG